MVGWTRGQMMMLGTAFALTTPFSAQAYQHSRHASHQALGRDTVRAIYAGVSHYSRYRFSSLGRYAGGALQCVPFARENTGIELTGNAVNWWDNAAGIYQRGARPEVGSILNFRGTSRMRLGHVAVVSNVVDSRSVQIDHANWSGRGVITRNVTVVDVSPFNDWSAVRVALGNGDFGSVYPTYGFIYDRPDSGTMLANAGVSQTAASMAQAQPIVLTAPVLNPAPLDFYPAAGRLASTLAPQQGEEVAEATDDASIYRTRRGGVRSMPVTHYGRAAMQVARYGFASTRGNRGGEMLLAQLGRGADRLTSGRMMGGQVLFMGHIASRGGRDVSFPGTGRTYYSGLVRQTVTHQRAGQPHAAASQPGRSQADNGGRRRNRRA